MWQFRPESDTLAAVPHAPQIALFHPGLIAGGIQRVFLNLARGFRDRGLQVDLVQATPGDELLSSVPPGVRVVDLNARRSMTSVPALAGYLRRQRPLALISGAIQTNVAAVVARRLAGVPVRLVLTEHNYIALTTRHAPTWRGRMTPHFVRMFYPHADRIVAVSQGVADELARVAALERGRIQVIYNPVLAPGLESLSREPLEHPWFRAGEPPVILAVGRLTRAKDYPTLLDAFALLHRQRSARLLILGEGEERPALEAQIARLGLGQDAVLAGMVANPYRHMRRAALFVLSSRFEGLPTVLIEALAVGAPVVATDCTSGPAEILGTREGLVPVEDPPALARAMAEALQRPPLRSPSLERFRLDAAVDAYLEVAGLGGYATTGGPASTNDR